MESSLGITSMQLKQCVVTEYYVVEKITLTGTIFANKVFTVRKNLTNEELSSKIS